MARARKKPLYTTERVSTGIYVNTKATANTTEGMKALLDEIARALNAAFDLPARLAEIEEQAARVLALPKNERPEMVAKDAGDAQFEVKCVRGALEAGDAARAVCHAITLGGIVERWSVRPFEPLVRDAKKISAGRAKGNASKQRLAQERSQRWQAMIDEYLTLHKRATYREACNFVVNDEAKAGRQVAWQVVRNSTVNPRTANQT